MATDIEPYGFDLDFERCVLAYVCSSPKFWYAIGQYLEAEALADPLSRLLFKTVQGMTAGSTRPPDNFLLVSQRLARQVREGSVSPKTLEAVGDYMDQADANGLPDMQLVIDEIAPILKRRYQKAALHDGLAAYGKKADMDATVTAMQNAGRIGQVTRRGKGLALGESSANEIRQSVTVDRLSTGIAELDSAIGGGLPRATMTMFTGGPGEGKSMALDTLAAASLLQQQFVVVVTTEVSRAMWMARLKAALTGLNLDGIEAGGPMLDKAMAMIEKMQLGPFRIEYLGDGSTTDDVTEFVQEMEAEVGRKVDHLIIDYADMLQAPKSAENNYLGVRNTFKALFDTWASPDSGGRGIRLSTASQSKASQPSKQAKTKDVFSAADSAHKERIVDLVITLNADESYENTELFIAKWRKGKGRSKIGPLPTCFSTARLVPVSWESAGWRKAAAAVESGALDAPAPPGTQESLF